MKTKQASEKSLQDEEIITLYWQRSERAITATNEKYGKYCGYIAQNILQNANDAEECVNDTWLRAWNAMPPKRPNRLATFLGKITRNLALNRYEKEHAKKRGGSNVELLLTELEDCIPDASGGMDIAEDFIVRDAMNRFLAALPAENRKLFVQRYWYFRTIREIAADCGMGESKVKMTLLRTRGELKQFLEEEGVYF